MLEGRTMLNELEQSATRGRNTANVIVSESVQTLQSLYEGLTIDARNNLSGGGQYLFVALGHDPDVTPSTLLPSISYEDSVYFMIPAATDLDDSWSKRASPTLLSYAVRGGSATIPAEDDWPSEIVQIMSDHILAAKKARWHREAMALLEDERDPRAGLYASAKPIDDDAPMMVEGLMRAGDVSVFYGAFDEFKTTLVLDLVTHIAMGSPWQGRAVTPRPVIWYALEGADEIPVRLRALEARLKPDCAWGNDHAPITVLDRIPETPSEWRAEVGAIGERWNNLWAARKTLGEKVDYPESEDGPDAPPIVVIDTLSIALAGEDEKGPRAGGFISECLDLLKGRPDMATSFPVASHVIVIHHQTKTGTDFAGHRAIAANTQGLYRVHRFGNLTDASRPLAGQLTPMRVKGIPRPTPMRFEVEIAAVEGTRQTAAILKQKAAAIPAELKAAIEALRECDNLTAIPIGDLNDCIDTLLPDGDKTPAAKRKARQRLKEKLESAGVIEPIEDVNGNVTSYRFNEAAY